jgi:DNA-binding NtrC family response regulator
MKKLILSGLASLLAVALVGMPTTSRAQASTNAPAKKAAPAKKTNNRAIPFHGNVKALDNNAKTLSVGKETFQVNSETKIIKMGKPATLADGEVGEKVAGQYHKDTDGKLTATSIRFGPKAPTESSNTKTNKP